MANLNWTNRSINNIMNQYLIDKGYKDTILFESRVTTFGESAMFTLTHQEGIQRNEMCKAVFSDAFIKSLSDDNAVNMICTMFKTVISEHEKLHPKNFENDSFQEEVTNLLDKLKPL